MKAITFFKQPINRKNKVTIGFKILQKNMRGKRVMGKQSNWGLGTQ